MKKRNILGALLCSVCLMAGSVIPVNADALRVVTLGADLSAEQQQTMMNYFKVNSNEVEILYITNADEREHLSSYVPLEQIGTRTVSCAYVRPTQSGGIKVRTANLNWVTGNMIASTLSTSGVKNCEVIAACPFEVSGTGALTGIQMAYERASGESLDPVKKQIATEEMVVTGNLADEVGKADATTVITQAKMQVIETGVQDYDEIYNIVVNVADSNGVAISEDELVRITDLLYEIAQQHYEYEDMRETLERVDGNVSTEDDSEEELVESDEFIETEEDEDSILNDIDEGVLGEDILATSTEDPTLEEMTDSDESEDSDTYEDSDDDWDMETETVVEDDDDDMDDDTEDEAVEEDPATVLDEEDYEKYQKLVKFCTGEYEGDAQALTEVMGEGVVAYITLESETASKVSKAVKDAYFDILKNGTDDFVADGTEMYISTELNVMNNKLKEIFTVGDITVDEDILSNLTQEDKDILYADTLTFFEKLYDENLQEFVEEGIYEEAVDESESYDEYYTEESSYEETSDTYYDEDYSEEEYYE